MRTFGNPSAIAEASIDQSTRVAPALTKTIPFDYVFEFKLQGKSANNVQDVVKLQDVVEISMQGVFVGVSIGYSFALDERKTPRAFGPAVDQTVIPAGPVLIPLFAPNVILSSPAARTDVHGAIVAGMPGAEVAVVKLIAPDALSSVTIGSDGTATLPLSIDAPATIRALDRTSARFGELIEIRSPGATGGGLLSTPVIGHDPLTNKLPKIGDKSVTVYGAIGDETNLFLLETTTGQFLELEDPGTLVAVTLGEGQTGRIKAALKLKDQDVEKALSAGSVLLVRSKSTQLNVPFSMFALPRLKPSTLTLGAMAAGLQSINVNPTSGFRLSQRFAKVFAAGVPLDQIDSGIVGSAFEPACGPEDISFLYSIDVVSTGRELQNKPIHNIAGLGIANGDRPFRPLARPVAFEPRSVIRIQIEELSTLPGTLYIVLQGYKLLGTARIPE